MASWSQFAAEKDIYNIPPKERDAALNEWENDILTAQTKSGAFDDPAQVKKVVHYIESKRGAVSRDVMDPPKPEDTASAVENRLKSVDEILVDHAALKDPKKYREAILASNASPLSKAIYASRRNELAQKNALTRRGELSKTIEPKALPIIEALQEGQEIFGIDVHDMSGKLKLEKDDDGDWTIPGEGTGWEKFLDIFGPAAGTVRREKLKELSDYQKKWGLSDQELQDDYMESLKATAPASVQRWFGKKTDLSSIAGGLGDQSRVVNADIGAPQIVVPDRNLIFKKAEYDAAVDAAPADDLTKQAAKEMRSMQAENIAPQLFNLLRNNRSDFENYAKETDMVKGTDAPKAMIKAVEDYYTDKKDQSWVQDMGEFIGQQGSALQEGFYRVASTPYAIAGFLGNEKAARLSADVARGTATQAQVDEMVSDTLGMPGTTKLARDVTNITPDLAVQVALAIPSGGLTTASAVGRVAAATGAEATVARQALQLAARAGGSLDDTTAALKAAGLSESLAKPAVDAAKWMTSKNLIKGGAGRQISLQSGYAGLTQMANTHSQIINQLTDEGMPFEEAMDKARLPAAIAGGITATITGLFSVAGRGGVEKPFSPGEYTVADIVRTGMWKELKDEASMKVVKQVTKSLFKDARDEAIEEGVDQFLQGVSAFAADPSKATQEKRIGDVINESAYAATLGGFAGGGAGLIRQVQSTNKLTGQQIKDTESLKAVIRKIAAGEITPEQGLASITTDVDADEVAKSLDDEVNNQAGELAQELAQNPNTSQTAAALAALAGKEIQQPKQDDIQTTIPGPTEDEQGPQEPEGIKPMAGQPEEVQVAPGIQQEPEITTPVANETLQTSPEQTPELQTGPETGTEIEALAGTEGAAAVDSGEPAGATVEGVQFDPFVVTPVEETESPGGEPVPTSGEPFDASGDRYADKTASGNAATDVVQPSSAKKPTTTGKVKSGLRIPAAPAGVSKKSQDAHAEVQSLTEDFLPALGGVFNGVEIIDSFPDGKSGGWYYNKKTGNLGIVLSDAARELGRVRDKKKWVAAAIAEEAIHSVATKLERQGKLDSKGLLRSLKREAPEVYNKVRAIYPSAQTEQAVADEFIRMLVQGRIKFEVGKKRVRIDGELTEMQFTPGIIASIKKILNQLLNIIRDLQGKIKNKELAAELDEVASMIESTLKSLVEQENARPPDEEFTWVSDDIRSQSSEKFKQDSTRPGGLSDGARKRQRILKEWDGPARLSEASEGEDGGAEWIGVKGEIIDSIEIPDGWLNDRRQSSPHTKWGSAYLYLRPGESLEDSLPDEGLKISIRDHSSGAPVGQVIDKEFMVPKDATLSEWARGADRAEHWLADNYGPETPTAADLSESGVGKTQYTKLDKQQNDGEGGKLDLYNVVGGPADGTTFALPEGASEAEVQAAADAKTEQFSGIAGTQSSDSFVTPEMDTAYLSAVAKGDLETAQRMVDEAAKAAGYNFGPVQHGSDQKFTQFLKEKIGSNRGTPTMGEGFYFGAVGDDIAGRYGDNIITAYLKMENPLTVTGPSEFRMKTGWEDIPYPMNATEKQKVVFQKKYAEQMKRATAKLREQGYDGVIWKQSNGKEFPVAFEPNQIKSADPVTRDADGNVIPLSQRFNPESDDIRFSQSSDNMKRAQEMGVPELGEARINESRKAILKAVRDEIFDASKAEVDNADDYQTVHDLITSLTKGDVGAALQKLKDKVADHPELAELPDALDALAATVYGEAIRYAIRQATDGTGGRAADFSLFKTALDNYNNLPKGALELLAGSDDKSASATTRIARIMASLQEVSEPMGIYLRWHSENAVQANKAMLKSGFDEAEIKAINDFITQPKKGPEMKKAVQEVTDSQAEKLAPVNAALGRLQENARKKAAKEPKPKEETPSEKLVREVGEQVAQAEDFSAQISKEGAKAVKQLAAEESRRLVREVGDDVAKADAFAKLVEHKAAQAFKEESDRLIAEVGEDVARQEDFRKRVEREARKAAEQAAKDASDQLIKEIGESVAQQEDFAKRIQQAEDDANKAASDALIEEVGDDVAREEDFAKRLQKQETDFNKSADKAIRRLMAHYAKPSNKPVGVREIVDAMMESPEHASNPAWRKRIVSEWLNKIGIEIPRIKLDQLDILIASVFADAQVKLLKDFNAKRGGKIQPTQMEKIAKAIKTGLITGSPVEWQTAFSEKFGTRPLTPEEMRDVLHYSSVISNDAGNYLRQDQVAANGRIAEIFRKAGAPPGFWQTLAASFTQSALTGMSTQTLQFTSGLVNWAARIYEDVLTGKGVTPVLNGIQLAYDAWLKAFHSARVSDSYRESQLDEIARLSTLKTVLEKKIADFKNAKGIAKARHIPGLIVGAQDFFRRLMSSADDSAVSGLRAYINAVATQSELRKAGVSQPVIDKMFDVAKEQMASLETEAEWQLRRPNFTEQEYQAWAMDKVMGDLSASMQQALAERLVAQNSDQNAEEIFNEINSFALREAEADVGVGPLRDKIADKGMTPKEAALNIMSDPLQFLGEWLVGDVIEKHLRLNPKDVNPASPIKNILARMIFGFVRTPLNIMSRSVFRGPLGLYRLLVSGAIMPGKFSQRAARMYARTMADARQQAQRRREGLVWTLTMATLYGLAKGLADDEEENDPLIINGQGPTDEQAKAAWKAAGHQPNSIEINMGDVKLSIPFGRSGLETVKPALMMLGTLDDLRLNGTSKGDPENLWQYAKTYGNNTIYNAALFGFRNAANWRQDTSGENAFLKRAAYAFSPLIPFSGFTKSIGKLVRPERPDDKTLAGAIAVSTPIFWIGENARNLYGQPVFGTPSSTVGDVTKRLLYGVGLPFALDTQSNPDALKVYEFSLKTGRAPSAPTRAEIDKRMLRADKAHLPMTDKEWTEYQVAAGKERFESMKQLAPRAEGMSDEAIGRNLDVINRRADNAGRRAVR